MIPGVLLFVIGVASVPFLSFFVPQALLPEAGWVYAILLSGALVQVIFASGYTVATLCGLARFSVLSRLCALLAYLATAQVIGTTLSPVTNALTYVAAMSFGSIALWVILWHRLGLDTSAAVQWRRKAGTWKPS